MRRYAQSEVSTREAVLRIFERADGGMSQRRIAHTLNLEGVRSVNGLGWSQATVARLLTNPLYIGQLRRGVYATKLIKGKSKKVRVGEAVFPGQHEGILDLDLFNRVNRSRSSPQRRAGGRPLGKGSHLMTRGLLRCGTCGSAMIPVNRPQNDGKEAYMCLGHRNQGGDFCPQLSVRRTVIDEPFLAELVSRYFDVDGTRRRLRDRQATELPLAKSAVSEAERDLVATESATSRLRRGWREGIIDDAEFQTQLSEVAGECEGAQAALKQARGRLGQIETAGASTDDEEAALRQLADLKNLVHGSVDRAEDLESLRTIIRGLVASVELCPPERFYGSGVVRDGVVAEQTPTAGKYHLIITVHPEAFDLDAFGPVRPLLPKKTPEEPTASRCRRS